MLIACSTITLKYRYCSGSPSSMVSPIEHAFSPHLSISRTNLSGYRSGSME
jgi:hypothetical protein